jgi:hypothetical protein
MEPVDLGYRVTLSYNLCLVDRNARAIVMPSISTATERLLENTIRALLADPAFLPGGGLLAVGLAHKYPMPPAPDDEFDPTVHYNELNQLVTSKTAAIRWGAVLQSLKGGDARMREVSRRVGLTSFVKLLYAPRRDPCSPVDRDVLLDDIPDLSGVHEGMADCFPEDLSSATEIARQGVILQRDRHRKAELKWMRFTRWQLIYPRMQLPVEQSVDELGEGSVPVHWLSDVGEQNLVRAAYIGGDTMIEHQHGTAALFIQIPRVGDGIRSS